MNGSSVPNQFIDEGVIYHADTCEPVDNAIKNNLIELSGFGRNGYPGTELPTTCLDGLLAVGHWNVKSEQNWGLGWHRNEGIEITFLEQGNLYFGVDEQEFLLQPGQWTVTRPWQKHTVGNPNVGPSRLHWLLVDVGIRQPHTPWQWPDWIVLSPTELDSLTSILRGNEYPVWPSDSETNELFKKIAKLTQKGPIEQVESQLKLYINELLLLLYGLLKNYSQPMSSVLTSAQRTVEIFLRELPGLIQHDWTLEEMAHHCHMGRTQFANYCKKITNKTPIPYLLEARVKKSQEMLSTTDLSITDIAFDCGFKSSQYFNTCFKKQLGITPSDFRKQKLEAPTAP